MRAHYSFGVLDRISMSVASALLIPSACLYALGLLYSRHAVDYREVVTDNKSGSATMEADAEAGVTEALLPGSQQQNSEQLQAP